MFIFLYLSKFRIFSFCKIQVNVYVSVGSYSNIWLRNYSVEMRLLPWCKNLWCVTHKICGAKIPQKLDCPIFIGFCHTTKEWNTCKPFGVTALGRVREFREFGEYWYPVAARFLRYFGLPARLRLNPYRFSAPNKGPTGQIRCCLGIERAVALFPAHRCEFLARAAK